MTLEIVILSDRSTDSKVQALRDSLLQGGEGVLESPTEKYLTVTSMSLGRVRRGERGVRMYPLGKISFFDKGRDFPKGMPLALAALEMT